MQASPVSVVSLWGTSCCLCKGRSRGDGGASWTLNCSKPGGPGQQALPCFSPHLTWRCQAGSVPCLPSSPLIRGTDLLWLPQAWWPQPADIALPISWCSSLTHATAPTPLAWAGCSPGPPHNSASPSQDYLSPPLWAWPPHCTTPPPCLSALSLPIHSSTCQRTSHHALGP